MKVRKKPRIEREDAGKRSVKVFVIKVTWSVSIPLCLLSSDTVLGALKQLLMI